MDELLLLGLAALGFSAGIIVGALAAIGAIWLLKGVIDRDIENADD